MGGSKDATLTADVEFMDSKDRKKWTRPPISMNFEVLFLQVNYTEIQYHRGPIYGEVSLSGIQLIHHLKGPLLVLFYNIHFWPSYLEFFQKTLN